ncbi:hypothetical protein CHS0354_032151 [Potamilus streckersoni]|uniref:Uncharacterized protein n=1 Tax=Potamilus streckersoni TaxID=2493646 RepID=A0AAE0WE56_9BIVA|nr:hypothetical protein CHS0354_032151 [Potamilus streckersoni]
MATAVTDSSFKDGHGSSICLDGFTSPRQLPCLHSFCEHCLQDYITKKASSTDKTLVEFMCPVCRALTRPTNKEKPVSEWASLFPNSPFPLVGKSKVERSCEVCSSSSDFAKQFCVVCEEFMCDNCTVYHQKMKMSKSHQIITIEKLENNPENRIRLREGFGCPEHDNEDIKFYCRSHESAFCGTCFFHHHRACQNVLELKQSLTGLLKEMNAEKIMEQMRKLEDNLKDFMAMNEENTGNTELDVNSILLQVGEIRKKLNAVLDDIEKMVKLEGNQIYKEWLIRKQEQNHHCQSLVSAIRNSQALLEMVGQFGSDTQKFLVTSKIAKQLQCYSDQTREKYEQVDIMRIRLELDSNMKAVLSKDAVGLVKIVCQEEVKDLKCTSLLTPLQKYTVEFCRVIDIHCPKVNNPSFFSIVQLPDGYIVLADDNNKTCYLYDSSFNFITYCILYGNPCSMCLIGENEVAVTMPSKKTIQLLSIRDHSMREAGMITTKYQCFSVDTFSREEILACGRCYSFACKRYYWSVISRNGNVKLHREFNCQSTRYAHAALDSSKSRVYISVSGGNAVYCFDLTDGKQYFVYSSDDLMFPMGVAVDRDDNIYVLGRDSNNIHKLSPDGVTLQVIISGVPQKPTAISFNYSRDQLCITNGSEMSKLHFFVHR